MGDDRPSRRRRRWAAHPLVHLVLALLVLALLQGFVVKPFQVPSGSMAPTLRAGDSVLVDRLAYLHDGPARGDVVVFERPASWGSAPERGGLRQALGVVGDVTGIGPSNLDALVKRVIGVGGDVVSCCGPGGAVLVDGEPLDEPYLEVGGFQAEACGTGGAGDGCFAPIEVPVGQLLVLGDDRDGSSDSVSTCRGAAEGIACARFVPEDAVLGEVRAVVLPLDRIAGSPSSSAG